jgi:mannose-6-phosphate isomerase-like protein (cupin superfamily)
MVQGFRTMGKRKKRTASSELGPKIRHLRRKEGLSLEDLARQTGLSVEYISRVEDQTEIPPVGAILQISKALSLDAAALLSQGGARDQRQRKRESLEKRKRSYAYKTLSAGADTMHLKAFLVSIDAHQDHAMVEYRHEGEEFLYVLKGEVEVSVGENRYHLSKGKSLHFKSSVSHMLRNPGSAKTELVVVLYVP